MGTTKRLFIGLMTDSPVQARLAAHQAQWSWPAGARLTPSAHFHITLHFLGEVDEDTTARLVEGLATVPAPRFELVLGRPGSFSGGIAFIEPGDCAPLRALHGTLGGVVRDAGLVVEQRPWHPHVTLARNAQGARPPDAPASIGWSVERVSLVWSRGGRYEELVARS